MRLIFKIAALAASHALAASIGAWVAQSVNPIPSDTEAVPVVTNICELPLVTNRPAINVRVRGVLKGDGPIEGGDTLLVDDKCPEKSVVWKESKRFYNSRAHDYLIQNVWSERFSARGFRGTYIDAYGQLRQIHGRWEFTVVELYAFNSAWE